MLSEGQIARLVEIAGPPLALCGPSVQVEGDRGSELQALLTARNGFYAFESALHVFPSVPPGASAFEVPIAVEDWNAAASTWKLAFGGMADGLWYFAEDVFGVQFAIDSEQVLSFDPETAEVQPIAHDIGGWIDAVLSDYRLLTGYSLANAWQAQHGPLAASKRLVPKIPFVLGGSYDISNLFEGDAVQGMKVRGNLAVQIRDLPDGTPIEYLPRS